MKELEKRVSTTAKARAAVKNERRKLSLFAPTPESFKTSESDLQSAMRKLANTPVAALPAPKTTSPDTKAGSPAPTAATKDDETAAEAVTRAATAVKQGANDMAKLDELWASLGKPNRPTADFLRARCRITDCADLVLAEITANT